MTSAEHNVSHRATVAPLDRPSGPGRRLRPVAAAAAAVTATGLVLAGCSSGSSGSSATTTGTSAAAAASAAASGSGAVSAASMAAIKADLKTAEGTPTWKAGGPAFKATGLTGKKAFLLGYPTNQFAESYIAGVTEGLKSVGMTVTVAGSADSVTSQEVQDLDNAVNAHVSVIILLAIVPSSVATGLQKAKAAGIPVIESFIGNPELPPTADQALGVYADATYPYSRTGQLAAEWEIAQTGGKVNSVVQQFAGQPPSDATAEGWTDTLKQYCPSSCSETDDNVTVGAQTVQQIQSGTQVAAQNNAVNAIFPVYDYQMAYMLPELNAASATSRINLLSENADLAQMQEMEQGTSVKVDVGNPVEWDGWASVDEALRALKGLPAVKDEQLPVRLFDTGNVKSIDLTANPATWYGGADYQADYQKLWGVSAAS
ncbi:MAG: sugar ABC transporter substrate-binding protein [Trebonia sp.]